MAAESHHGSEAVVRLSRFAIFACCYIENGYVPIAPFLVSRAEVGVLLSAQYFGGFFVLVPTGLAIDSCGPLPILQRALLASMAGVLLGAVCPSFWCQLVSRATLGGSFSGFFNACISLIMERFSEPSRSRHLGSAVGLGTLGNMVGPPAMGAVYDLAAEGQQRFWALVHPLLLLALAFWMLNAVPPLSQSTQPLLQDSDSHDKVKSAGTPSAFFSKALGVYVSVGLRAWILALELVCLFGCSSAAITASALEMHRRAFSPTAIGLTAIPAGLMQSLFSQWSGRFASSAKNREAVLLSCPAILCLMALCIAAIGFVDCNSLLPILLILMTCSAVNGAADPTSMSMMADLAKGESLGYGQAVTASEMAVALGLGTGPCLAHVMRDKEFSLLCLLISLVAFCAFACSFRVLRNIPHNCAEDGEVGEANGMQH